MKIAFEGQIFLDENKTGIAWNAHNLILELAKYPENQCMIQCFSGGYGKQQMCRLEEYQSAGCRIEYSRRFKSSWYKLAWLIFGVPYRFFFRMDADIVQFFNFAVPPGVNGKCVTIIYDMAYKSCPQTISRKTRLWLRLCMKKSCRHADHIVTISEFSKREIIRWLHMPKEKITVVPSAVDHTVYRPDYTKEQIQRVRDKYQIVGEYFLYLGTIEPRKNLERLIGAYERLCQEKPQAPQLVLAGKRGWLCADIYKKARRLGKKILFTGYVGQEDSPALMCGAKAFVFPSLYEGFGLPPLEAMACGTPVILSNTSALAEVAGDAGSMVDPESEEEICQAMKMLLEDDAYRDKLSRLGIERAERYTWASSAEKLMELYRNMQEFEKL